MVMVRDSSWQNRGGDTLEQRKGYAGCVGKIGCRSRRIDSGGDDFMRPKTIVCGFYVGVGSCCVSWRAPVDEDEDDLGNLSDESCLYRVVVRKWSRSYYSVCHR